MKFDEVFREKYRVALYAARAGEEENTILGIQDLYNLFIQQYNKKNNDPIAVKAKLASWMDIFYNYLCIIKKYGLNDVRIQKFFDLVDNVDAPSFSDFLDGKKDANDIGKIEEEPQIEEPKQEKILPPNLDGLNEPKIDELPKERDNSIIGTERKKVTYTPQCLNDFIGQGHIVRDLKKEIAIAKTNGLKHLDNILLFGNPGLGKTTLMELIAKELGVRFELLDCSQFRNSQQSLKALQNFFMRIARENEPVVIALDEIHMLTDELQSSLLTLLNNRVYVSPLDINGQCKRFAIDEFTFIAATTDDDKVLDTIKNRCLKLTFQLVDYTFDELKQIYKNKVLAKGLTITEEAIDLCIPRSRGAIRYVNAIIDGLDTALYNDEGYRISTNIDLDVAKQYFEEKGIDPMGLYKKDLEILEVIKDAPNGVIGADVLSARVGLDTKKYLSEYERYLVKIGFINVMGRGRSLTEKAQAYLKGDKVE